MIVVCDNTDIAQVFFENISGQSGDGGHRQRLTMRMKKRMAQSAKEERTRMQVS